MPVRCCMRLSADARRPSNHGSRLFAPFSSAVDRAIAEQLVRRTEQDIRLRRVDRERCLALRAVPVGDVDVRPAKRPRVPDRANREVVDEKRCQREQRRDDDCLDQQPLATRKEGGQKAALPLTSRRATRYLRPRLPPPRPRSSRRGRSSSGGRGGASFARSISSSGWTRPPFSCFAISLRPMRPRALSTS